MIITLNAYFIICGIFALVCALPALYTRFVKKQGNKMDWTYLLVFLLIPVNWYTPGILTVTSCDEYTKDVLMFPSSEYSLGKHCYIINKTDSKLYLNFIVYGDVDKDEIHEDAIIDAGTTYKAPIVSVNHVLTNPPESVRTKSDGQVESVLLCRK